MNITQTIEQSKEFVDLGLPSGTLWATCNIGASKPEDYGNYFTWGETKEMTNYDLSEYFDLENGSSSNFIKYAIGKKIQLNLEDDAAHVNLGDNWCMPTKVEFDELCEKCKWTWTSKNGHSGCTVTGSNGNSIFLPAAGYRYGTSSIYVGKLGFYWSSTLSSLYSSLARYLNFYNEGHYIGNYYRKICQSIRPVKIKDSRKI